MLINPPTWTQNGAYTAEQDRQLIGAIVRTEGVANANGMVPRVVTNSRQVSISAGGAYIAGDYAQSGGGGMYFVYNDGAYEVALPVAGSLPRYDLVVLRIYDSAVSGSVNEARFDVVSGTPAASPRVPAVPRSSIAIGAVKVNPGAAQLQLNDLADQRVVAQINGTVTGNVNTYMANRLDQVATPASPVLITRTGAADDLQISTGGGFHSVGGSDIYHTITAMPKSATEGTIATDMNSGRTYQYREGMWKMFIGWGPYTTIGSTADTAHTGPYVGNLILNAGASASWGNETPKSSPDYSTYYSLVKGTSGSTLSRAGGITFKRPGKYHVEMRYQVIGRVNGTGVRSRMAGPGISQFTAADNQENYVLLGKGQEHTITTSGTIIVSNTGASTHGKLVPWIKTTAAVTLSTVLMRVEMEYEF